MKRFLIYIAAAGISFLLASCAKEISGCTDQTATNYNSSATKSDGSCQYDGNVTFWTNSIATHGNSIAVTLDDGQTTTITVQYSTPQACVSGVGGVILNVPRGTHTYTTKDAFNSTSSGSVSISLNECTTQQIN